MITRPPFSLSLRTASAFSSPISLSGPSSVPSKSTAANRYGNFVKEGSLFCILAGVFFQCYSAQFHFLQSCSCSCSFSLSGFNHGGEAAGNHEHEHDNEHEYD